MLKVLNVEKQNFNIHYWHFTVTCSMSGTHTNHCFICHFFQCVFQKCNFILTLLSLLALQISKLSATCPLLAFPFFPTIYKPLHESFSLENLNLELKNIFAVKKKESERMASRHSQQKLSRSRFN